MVIVQHEARKLAGWAAVTAETASPIEIRLQPWGTVTGRMVDSRRRAPGPLLVPAPGDRQAEAGAGVGRPLALPRDHRPGRPVPGRGDRPGPALSALARDRGGGGEHRARAGSRAAEGRRESRPGGRCGHRPRRIRMTLDERKGVRYDEERQARDERLGPLRALGRGALGPPPRRPPASPGGVRRELGRAPARPLRRARGQHHPAAGGEVPPARRARARRVRADGRRARRGRDRLERHGPAQGVVVLPPASSRPTRWASG